MGLNKSRLMFSNFPLSSLKEKQRQEREELILEAVEEVFMEKGYYEASMDEIAARVGIAKGTVYLHFPSKEELVVAIFQRDMEKLRQLIKTTIASSLTPRAKAEIILEQLWKPVHSSYASVLFDQQFRRTKAEYCREESLRT
jgi:TetR/AcrR family transcriptional regulator, fatty acid metabolism regulator protein